MPALAIGIPVGVGLDHVSANDVQAPGPVHDVPDLSRCQPEWLGTSGAHHVVAVHAVHVEGEVGFFTAYDFPGFGDDVIGAFFEHFIGGDHGHATVVTEFPEKVGTPANTYLYSALWIDKAVQHRLAKDRAIVDGIATPAGHGVTVGVDMNQPEAVIVGLTQPLQAGVAGSVFAAAIKCVAARLTQLQEHLVDIFQPGL